MAEKTDKNNGGEPDFAELWDHLKDFVKRQINNPKWQDKTAVEVFDFLDFTLSFWETCKTKNPTSWEPENEPF